MKRKLMELEKKFAAVRYLNNAARYLHCVGLCVQGLSLLCLCMYLMLVCANDGNRTFWPSSLSYEDQTCLTAF